MQHEVCFFSFRFIYDTFKKSRSMGDSFLKLQEMYCFRQNVCIEVYGILNTSFTPLCAVFAFQNCLMWFADNKGQTCYQEKRNYPCVAYSVLHSLKKEIL